MFSQNQVAEFKEGFQFMDRDKDGIIGKSDLRAMYDEIGRIASDQELDDMLNEASGPINFTMFLNMFAEKQSGEIDDDELVRKAFLAYADEEGMIDADHFRHSLMVFGDKFSNQECDDAFNEFDIDENNKMEAAEIISMLTASAQTEEGAE